MSRRLKDHEARVFEPDWFALANRAKGRDGNRCRVCSSTVDLRVHHRCYDSMRTPLEMKDLITLCERCHTIFHATQHNPKEMLSLATEIMSSRVVASVRVTMECALAAMSNPTTVDEIAKEVDRLMVEAGGKSNLSEVRWQVRRALLSAEAAGLVRLTWPSDILVERLGNWQ